MRVPPSHTLSLHAFSSQFGLPRDAERGSECLSGCSTAHASIEPARLRGSRRFQRTDKPNPPRCARAQPRAEWLVAGGQKARENGGEPRFAISRVRCERAADVRTVRLATRGADGDVAEVAILEAHGVESALLVGRMRTSAALRWLHAGAIAAPRRRRAPRAQGRSLAPLTLESPQTTRAPAAGVEPGPAGTVGPVCL